MPFGGEACESGIPGKPVWGDSPLVGTEEEGEIVNPFRVSFNG